jgi:hypothetical protein
MTRAARGPSVGRMPTSFHQLPHVSGARAHPMSSGRMMAWLTFLFAFAWPRLTIIAFWIFGNTLGGAYDGWVIPALGFLLLPWTTMAYALMWGLGTEVVSGAEWAVIAVALGADLLTWIGARALR